MGANLHVPLLVLLLPPLAAQGAGHREPLYRPIDLGTLPGWTHSRAQSVNDRRQVTGQLSVEGAESMAFVWLPRPDHGLPAGMSPLGTLALGASNGSFGSEINDCGQIVGGAVGNTPGSASTTRGFLWEGGVLRDLGSLAGGASSWSGATAISRDGTIVGWSDVMPGSPSFPSRAFATRVRCGDRAHGGLVDLGSLGSWSRAEDVNERGQVVGTTGLRVSPSSEIAAPFFLDPRGGMTDLPLLAGSSSGLAVALNERGAVVGSCLSSGASGVRERAVLWHRGRTGWSVTEIGTFMGLARNTPTDIDERGRVVGYSFANGELEGPAFVWIDGVFHALDDLLVTDRPVHIVRTGRMNDHGDIAASGYDAQGRYRAFLLLRLR